MLRLTTPIADDEIRALHAGDTVYLNGIIVTGRDAAHKFMVEHFIKVDGVMEADRALHASLKELLGRGVIYHCGPVVQRDSDGRWRFVAAGPTTSIREEVYQADVIRHFNLKGVIGKGGMAGATLRACQEQPAIYLHAIGGAASLIAQTVTEVLGVHKMEFGVPEAMWIIRVQDLPLVVTMDSHGTSIHDAVAHASAEKLAGLLAT